MSLFKISGKIADKVEVGHISYLSRLNYEMVAAGSVVANISPFLSNIHAS